MYHAIDDTDGCRNTPFLVRDLLHPKSQSRALGVGKPVSQNCGFERDDRTTAVQRSLDIVLYCPVLIHTTTAPAHL